MFVLAAIYEATVHRETSPRRDVHATPPKRNNPRDCSLEAQASYETIGRELCEANTETLLRSITSSDVSRLFLAPHACLPTASPRLPTAPRTIVQAPGQTQSNRLIPPVAQANALPVDAAARVRLPILVRSTFQKRGPSMSGRALGIGIIKCDLTAALALDYNEHAAAARLSSAYES